ncbi:MAG: hypothetical protein IJ333_05450 [Clostridia bacterium]|nr:hypothetical protein [Clostridia bacterium]
MESLYAEYAEKIAQKMNLYLIFMIIVLTILLGFIIYFVIQKDKKSIYLPLISGIILAILVYFPLIYPAQNDIKENAYITYVGEFYVEETWRSQRGFDSFICIKCLNEEKTTQYKMSNKLNVENNTEYSGYFVYGKNSKIMVDFCAGKAH